VFLLKTVIPVMAVLLLLQGSSLVLRSALVIAGREPATSGSTTLDKER